MRALQPRDRAGSAFASGVTPSDTRAGQTPTGDRPALRDYDGATAFTWTRIMRYALLSLALACLAACTSGPKIRADQDPAADFSIYRSYAFVEQPGTDRAGYSTLITTHFKNAIQRQMEARGYTLTDENPDLLVNFFTSMSERTDTRAAPGVFLGTRYYRDRFGLYTAWPLYARGSETTRYEVGTASVDVVDAARKQLIWEGVAEGRITSEARENPGPAIAAAVEDIFARYPVKPGSLPPSP